MDDITGEICHSSETVMNWKGEIVHRDNLDIRNPQELVFHVRPENNKVKNPRPFKYNEIKEENPDDRKEC